jgi:hypothetical protein
MYRDGAPSARFVKLFGAGERSPDLPASISRQIAEAGALATSSASGKAPSQFRESGGPDQSEQAMRGLAAVRRERRSPQFIGPAVFLTVFCA